MTKSASFRDLSVFLLLTIALSWGVGGLYYSFREPLDRVFGPLGPANPFYTLINCAPSLAAILASYALGGDHEIKILLSRLVAPFTWWWALVATLFIPAMMLALLALSPWFDPAWPVTLKLVFVDMPLVMFTTAHLFANIAPIGEELGWRGYALPRLLERTNATFASLILAVVWIIWHLPGFVFSGAMAREFDSLGWWCLTTAALSLVMTFLFIRSNGNVILAGVIPHFVINGAGAVGAWLSRPPEAVAMAVLALLLIALFGTNFVRFQRAVAS